MSISSLQLSSTQPIVARDKEHLKSLIRQEIRTHGYECDLNHIDVSQVKDLSCLFFSGIFTKFNGNISQWVVSGVQNMAGMFSDSRFTGDISTWDVSAVDNMAGMFHGSSFNGDISGWNVSKVTNMIGMFSRSKFNGNISQWDVSRVRSMDSMFEYSSFTGNLSAWQPLRINSMTKMFAHCLAPQPYWLAYEDPELRRQALALHELNKCLEKDLTTHRPSRLRGKV